MIPAISTAKLIAGGVAVVAVLAIIGGGYAYIAAKDREIRHLTDELATANADLESAAAEIKQCGEVNKSNLVAIERIRGDAAAAIEAIEADRDRAVAQARLSARVKGEIHEAAKLCDGNPPAYGLVYRRLRESKPAAGSGDPGQRDPAGDPAAPAELRGRAGSTAR